MGQLTENPRVGGSIPPLGTIFNLVNSHSYGEATSVSSIVYRLHFFALDFPDDAAIGRDMDATYETRRGLAHWAQPA
jgi:hypothetical protein